MYIPTANLEGVINTSIIYRGSLITWGLVTLTLVATILTLFYIIVPEVSKQLFNKLKSILLKILGKKIHTIISEEE